MHPENTLGQAQIPSKHGLSEAALATLVCKSLHLSYILHKYITSSISYTAIHVMHVPGYFTTNYSRAMNVENLPVHRSSPVQSSPVQSKKQEGILDFGLPGGLD
jgi:hypothetical protein